MIEQASERGIGIKGRAYERALRMEHRLQTPRAAGVVGLVFSALFVVSMVLILERPARGSSPEQIADFYLKYDAGPVHLLGMYLIPFAGIAYLWFIAAISSHLGERDDRFFATAFLGSGILFVAMLFASAAAVGALPAAIKFQNQLPPDANTFLLARALAFTLLLRIRRTRRGHFHAHHVHDRLAAKATLRRHVN